MKRFLKKYTLIIVLAFVSFQAGAQCAMCRAALETNEQGIQPESVNDGIVYLMVFPYLLVAVVGYAVYRLRKKTVNKKEEA
jgi:hypothetical protein